MNDLDLLLRLLTYNKKQLWGFGFPFPFTTKY